MATPMMIEEGKFYCNRRGERIGPMKPAKLGPTARYQWQTPNGAYFTDLGKATSGPMPNDSDLMSLWNDDGHAPHEAERSPLDLRADLDELVRDVRRTPSPSLLHQRRGASAQTIGNMVDPDFNAKLAIDHINAAVDRLRGGREEAAIGALFAAINTLTATVLLVRERA